MPRKIFNKELSKESGFTMIELMVVITVIAILTTVAIGIYSGVQAKARDAKRKSDIDEIRKAMELSYTSGTQTPYKAPTGSLFEGSLAPKDPKVGFVYTFISTNPSYNGGLPTSGNFGNYIVCAQLENRGGNARNSNGDIPVNPGVDDTHYCKKNAQ